jgi:hypothetical protein
MPDRREHAALIVGESAMTGLLAGLEADAPPPGRWEVRPLPLLPDAARLGLVKLELLLPAIEKPKP